MRWTGYKLGLGMVKACTEFWWGNLRKWDHWRDPDVDGRIILSWSFKR
jgi:hypothetical protein